MSSCVGARLGERREARRVRGGRAEARVGPNKLRARHALVHYEVHFSLVVAPRRPHATSRPDFRIELIARRAQVRVLLRRVAQVRYVHRAAERHRRELRRAIVPLLRPVDLAVAVKDRRVAWVILFNCDLRDHHAPVGADKLVAVDGQAEQKVLPLYHCRRLHYLKKHVVWVRPEHLPYPAGYTL